MSRRLVRSLLVHTPFVQSAAIAAKRTALQLAKRPFEPEFEVLRNVVIGEGECLVDIGANRGQSIDAMRLYCSDALVVAFEPQKRLADSLKSRNCPLVDIRQKALAREPKFLTLFTPQYRGWMFDGLASLDRDEAQSWLNARTLLGFDTKNLTLVAERVAVSRFDDEYLSPAFVKIDVQGGESDVIAGGVSTIDRHKPIMLIETGTNEGLVSEIEALGYLSYNYRDGQLVPRRTAVRNAVFVHPKRKRGL
jgi:FkbM family methyltransferase